MKDTKWGWVSKQLEASALDQPTKDAVVYVLERLRKEELDDDQELRALQAAVELVQGHSIEVARAEERWGPVVPGYYAVKDTVRVKKDAFGGDLAREHNGKRGRVVATRNGFVVVVLDESPSSEIQMHYRPEHLERLIV